MNAQDTKILLIEDNPDDIELTLRAFKKHNLKNKIIVARDGEEALDFMFSRNGKNEEHWEPDLILLDLNLPKIDGLQVLEKLKNDIRTTLIPIVVLTSSNEESDLAKSYHFGANSFIQKPVNYEKFSDVVMQIGLYWLLLNKVSKDR